MLLTKFESNFSTIYSSSIYWLIDSIISSIIKFCAAIASILSTLTTTIGSIYQSSNGELIYPAFKHSTDDELIYAASKGDLGILDKKQPEDTLSLKQLYQHR